VILRSLWKGEINNPEYALAPSDADVLRAVISEICVRHQVSETELASLSRTQRVAQARQEAYFRLYEIRYAGGRRRFSTIKIGAHFGRDHSTILHGIEAFKRRQGAPAKPKRVKPQQASRPAPLEVLLAKRFRRIVAEKGCVA